MIPSSIVELSEVTGNPRVKMMLPVPLPVGSRIALHFQVQRTHGERQEVLDVQGDFRVMSSIFDPAGGVGHQHLTVQSTGREPTWRAVKKVVKAKRALAPAKGLRTEVP